MLQIGRRAEWQAIIVVRLAVCACLCVCVCVCVCVCGTCVVYCGRRSAAPAHECGSGGRAAREGGRAAARCARRTHAHLHIHTHLGLLKGPTFMASTVTGSPCAKDAPALPAAAAGAAESASASARVTAPEVHRPGSIGRGRPGMVALRAVGRLLTSARDEVGDDAHTVGRKRQAGNTLGDRVEIDGVVCVCMREAGRTGALLCCLSAFCFAGRHSFHHRVARESP